MVPRRKKFLGVFIGLFLICLFIVVVKMKSPL